MHHLAGGTQGITKEEQTRMDMMVVNNGPCLWSLTCFVAQDRTATEKKKKKKKKKNYRKTDMVFSQERMKGNSAIHPTMVNSTCLSERKETQKP